MELRTRTASDGMVLTNGETFGKSVYLGENDSFDNWHEITEEEYYAILKEQQEKTGLGVVDDI